MTTKVNERGKKSPGNKVSDESRELVRQYIESLVMFPATTVVQKVPSESICLWSHQSRGHILLTWGRDH